MPDQILFYPLDITYKIKNDKAVIYIYGKTADNQRICVTDPNFQPYFYIRTKSGLPPLTTTSFTDELRSLRVPFQNGVAEVVDVQHVEKVLNGVQIPLLKVFTKLPPHVPIIKEHIKTHPAVHECFEYDILFARRYLMDTGIVPLAAAKASGELITEHSRVPVFQAQKIEPAGIEASVPLRILTFDIETYNPDGKRMQPEKNPIVMIALYGKDNDKEFRKVLTWKRFPTTRNEIEFVTAEFELLRRFKEVVDDYRPDILAGYYSDGFDLPYLATRAKKYRLSLDLGLDYSAVNIDQRSTEAKLTGIVHLDVLKFVRNVLGRSLETDVFTLDAVANELIGEHKHDVDINALAFIWDNRPDQLEKYCDYNLHDARITFQVCEKILPNIEELVKIIGLSLFDVSRMSFSRLVENYIFTQCKNFNELAPNKPDHSQLRQRHMQTYEGAFVYQPTPGLYTSVVVFDFRSLYPSIITSHNVSPSTFRCSCCTTTIPGTNDWFCKKKKGFLPSVLENIITRRMRIKEMIKSSTEPNMLLDARSNALKLLANAFYGYLGFAPARWYSFESASSITALGRYHINQVIQRAQAAGFSVLYSDTDSIFLELRDKTEKDAIAFIAEINADLPGLMELDYEGFYPAGIFVSAKAGAFGAKKKYALVDKKGRLKIRGFETVRRNWSVIAKELQENVLNIILKEKDVEKALAHVKSVISGLKGHTIPLEKTMISTQLQKPTEAYDSVGPHVAVARRMMERGVDVTPGIIINFIVTAGKGPIRDRAKLPEEIINNEYDADYYINNQIIPSIDRIFAVFGINIQETLLPKTQSTLGQWF